MIRVWGRVSVSMPSVTRLEVIDVHELPLLAALLDEAITTMNKVKGQLPIYTIHIHFIIFIVSKSYVPISHFTIQYTYHIHYSQSINNNQALKV